jgi:hypothetical protein
LLLFTFIFTFGSALIANGIFGVPLYQIVDANFSVMLFGIALSLLFTGYRSGRAFVDGQFLAAFLLLLLLVLTFAQALIGGGAYLLYARFDHVDLMSRSFVFVGYGHVVVEIARIFGVAMTDASATSPIEWRQTVSDISSIGGIVSLIITVATLFAGRSQARG